MWSIHTNSMSEISWLLLTQFWPNCKGRFLEPSWTDSNCKGDICPGDICQGNICTYQEYLGCYWPNFEQTFWAQFFWGLNFLAHFFLIKLYHLCAICSLFELFSSIFIHSSCLASFLAVLCFFEHFCTILNIFFLQILGIWYHFAPCSNFELFSSNGTISNHF